jgi:hypothetical protein
MNYLEHIVTVEGMSNYVKRKAVWVDRRVGDVCCWRINMAEGNCRAPGEAHPRHFDRNIKFTLSIAILQWMDHKLITESIGNKEDGKGQRQLHSTNNRNF